MLGTGNVEFSVYHVSFYFISILCLVIALVTLHSFTLIPLLQFIVIHLSHLIIKNKGE